MSEFEIDAINIIGAAERAITCMQRSTFDPVFQFYQDDDYQIPDSLAGSTFAMQVRNKAGDLILDFSSAVDGGIVVQNGNELAFLKTATQMDVPLGTYRYDLNETNSVGETFPLMKGDFVVQKKETRTA